MPDEYRGNIDLWDRPTVPNPEGGLSTLFSMGANFDGEEVLIPRVRHGLDRIMSEDEAVEHHLSTGEHLGRFGTVEEAQQEGERLHVNQEEIGRLKEVLRGLLNPQPTLKTILQDFYGR